MMYCRKGDGPNKDTVIVAFSAMNEGFTGQLLSEGLNDFLPKPFTKGDLFSMLKKWIKMDAINDNVQHNGKGVAAP